MLSGKPIMQEMREKMRRLNYAYKTELSYCEWVRRFIKETLNNRD